MAALCASLVLVLCILAASPAAHHWLHHDSDQDGHDCAVVTFAHGLTSAETVTVLTAVVRAIAPVAQVCHQPEIASPAHVLPPGQGPPLA